MIIWSEFYVTVKLEALTDFPQQTAEKYTKISHCLLKQKKEPFLIPEKQYFSIALP